VGALSDNPIGTFDSGVGGLSVLREIRRELPLESVLYVADSGNAPYGERPAEYIQERSVAITRALVERGAKAVVVACNTATAAAVGLLRHEFKVPIVAIEPAVKPAVAATRTGVVGVMATSVTISSTKLLHLVGQYPAPGGTEMQACPGLAEQVERCQTHHLLGKAVLLPLARVIRQPAGDRMPVGGSPEALQSRPILLHSWTRTSNQVQPNWAESTKDTSRHTAPRMG